MLREWLILPVGPYWFYFFTAFPDTLTSRPVNNFLLRKYQKTVNSIAFYPAIISLGFLILCGIMITLDYSTQGKLIKSELVWLRLRDASTARSIITAIAAGLLSLTVFSFSMVMIVLNQAASQMSNRVLGQLIGNRFQQIVLGIYIGTIIYAFFLLSTIRDVESGIYIPALSIYLLMFFTIFDIFLFIYFLHYITQSVKYEVVIKKIVEDTLDAMKKSCPHSQPVPAQPFTHTSHFVKATESGIYERIDLEALQSLCSEHGIQINVVVTPGTFVLPGTPLMGVSKMIPESLEKQIIDLTSVRHNQTIQGNYFYGFSQLREIGLRALSTGVNDPGTAILSLHALVSLFLYRSSHFPAEAVYDQQGKILIVIPEISFDALVLQSLRPLWDYGQDDRLFCNEMHLMCLQLQGLTSHVVFKKLLSDIEAKQSTFNADYK
ncbi:hypothetical protein BWI93_17815 [Siphonobacter sp. BAB-5385]|uniref:DUF2254 domain-containing protein n=1 Tax=Siphonobacter sp. BAB-5385 TaxID=1864822 RepID=UPI000B9DD1ED|nr:DUF2254 domain-containing protein [Siphonobacter sp. BAB-5385]OZI06855.1 hypothetical protein BWI93_17815 [Siphonobacter sp. BAB-5385]